ncbi:cAMP-dependent protein kinase inhibitor alpha [Oryzias melastigma]|uniref:cAMP-dependent protein kinase inhibitor alpha n=1 Tax=Oryzias melastigma TaxID=30732 RepID=A0A3B3DKP4_ORYME|nr:cAMP-dependent protein kinase inhibitor alpha [Oryzias melastigma]KAF6722863.1 cAMP-dependent protein kinase inhibitor alpha [Oryzias melastigma]
MTDAEESFEDFIASRRSGRRNAVHEIPTAETLQGSTDLSQRLVQLSISKSEEEEGESESNQDSTAKDEEVQAEDG